MALMNTLYAFTSLPSQLKTRQYNPKYSPNGIRQQYMVTGEVYKTLHGAIRQLAQQNQVLIVRRQKAKKGLEVEVEYVQTFIAVYCSLGCVP